MPKRGRKTSYSKKLANKICTHIAEGKSLRDVCALNGMPGKSTILAWLCNESDFQKDFQDQYARARMAQAYGWADEIVEIADDGINDTYSDDEGNERTDHDVIQRSKLRVDTRKWLLSKLLPKEYGDQETKQEPNKKGRILLERAPTRKSQRKEGEADGTNG